MNPQNQNISPEFKLAKPDVPVEMIDNHWLRIRGEIAEFPIPAGEGSALKLHVNAVIRKK